MNDNVVSLDIAKKLKDIGFDEDCEYYYQVSDCKVINMLPKGKKSKNYEYYDEKLFKVSYDEITNSFDYINNTIANYKEKFMLDAYTITKYKYYCAPTLYDIQQYIIKKYNYYVNVILNIPFEIGENDWAFNIIDMSNLKIGIDMTRDINVSDKTYFTYQEDLNAGIYEFLTNYINKL